MDLKTLYEHEEDIYQIDVGSDQQLILLLLSSFKEIFITWANAVATNFIILKEKNFVLNVHIPPLLKNYLRMDACQTTSITCHTVPISPIIISTQYTENMFM